MQDPSEQKPDRVQIARRHFLSWSIGLIGTFIGAALTIPILGYAISPALRRQGQTWADAGPESNLRTGEPVRVEYLVQRKDGWIETAEQKSAWVMRTANGTLISFDPRCTHLGCPYSWDATSKRFLCPCHNGVFGPDGNVISGPPPRPLDRFQARLQDGKVMILEEAPHA
jgi:menaquinol-cytochrome c reductase iron-sulfur subunit